MSDNIKVVVKVRPLIQREISEKLSYQWRINNNTLYQIGQHGKETGQSFTFEKVYDQCTKTKNVYDDVAKPIVEAAIAGINGTIFAYGQTSSGKTYTMSGSEELPGLIQLAVYDLFNIIKNTPDRDFCVKASYIEIYNETLKDLLDVEKKNIKIKENLQGVKVNATEIEAATPEEVLNIMKIGEANRHVGATNMNEESSRSHSIFQITITSKERIEDDDETGCVNMSQLNLVDLAGSERSGQTGATGQRFKEGTHINKSLSVLALVIKQLSEDPNRFINYRDSKLTRLLQNSLGGNAKTSIICAVTPAAVDETISTLQFANRAKAITNNPEVNAVVTDRTTIQTLTNQLARLQSQLEGKKNLEQDNYNLNKQIAALQRLITSDLVHRDSAGNERRKCASRRATIAGHSFDAPDPVPFAAPSFLTPLFKHNINTTPFSMVSTMSTSSRLPIVDEETIGEHSTLKKQEKKIDFSDEIITIDSDGEESIKSNDCSPNHKCYDNSKTPPCVLRKNVRLVEKELKDIIDFTELEKQYPPEVVELTRDLQVKRDTILQLEEKINFLNEKDKDNKAKIEELIQKLEQSEHNVESITKTKDAMKVELTTKITDLEVSYETLKKKANVREEELLSLIKEQQSVTTKSQASETVNFLNISKDLSLVNTDSDDSFETTKSQNKTNLLEQLKKQLDEIVVSSHEEIEMLKNENFSLKTDIEVFKGNVETLVNENSSMKTEIEKLNASLNNQKESLHEEIEYYNSVICNLHGKLGDMQLIRIEEIFIKNLFNNRLNEFKTKFTEIVNKVNTLIEFNKKTCIDSANSIENLNKKIADLEIAIETKNQTIDELNIQIEDLIMQKSSLTKDNENVTSELISKNEKLKELESQLVESNSNYNRLRGEILLRDELITSLKEKEKTISFEMKSLVLEKDTHISNIQLKLREIQETLENEIKSHNDVVKIKTNDIALLKNKLKNLEKLLDEKEDQLIDLTNNVYDSTEDSVIEVPLQLLTFVGDLITSLKQNMFYDHIDKKISHEEGETQSETDREVNIKIQLREVDDSITTSNLTLKEKIVEIEKALERVKKFKDTMIKNENLYKEKIEELQIENKALQTRFDELEKDLSKTKDCDELKKSVENLPHSLCTNVINTFHFNKDNSEGIFNNNRDLNSTYCQGEHICTSEFYRQQISELNSTITELKFENSKLLDEQVIIRNEVQSLVESIKTLNKKILQHKTALSTKGATSFAENKLLKSQIRATEHNFARIFSMINKDLPLLKEKLISLMTLLHDDHPYDIGVTDLLTCSLYRKSDTKNESTMDGDLLMLDTNITLTTVNDTLTNHDQTCFESTQILCDNEVVDEPNQAVEINVGACSETTTLKYYDANEKIESDMDIKNINESNCNEKFGSCKNCSHTNELRSALDEITIKMEQILKDQSEIKLQKNDIEKKYIAKTQEADDLTEKLNNIVKECNHKSQEVDDLKKSLNSKNNTLKELQVENDTLSTQIMENISEVEYAKKEIELLLEKNKKLKETCENVMTVTFDKNHESGPPFILHSKINRRHSDSASTSRCNKICTLRNELNAGRDVCKELTENIASIKSELDHSAMNMDIISDAVGTENIDNGTNSNSLPNVPEESQDIYLLDKSLCSDYYTEKTGAQTKNICQDTKIVDIMKMLYTDITTKHANEIENLNNKLKSDNEFITFLKIQLAEFRSKVEVITRELEDKNIFVETTQNTLSALRKYANDVKTNISKLNTNEHNQMTLMLNELLQKLDVEFNLPISEIFERISALLSKTQSGLIDSCEKYECLLRLSETLNIEVNDLKAKLNNKSSEYNTLETKLEKTKEIASAVTLDLIGRERLLHNVIDEKYKIMVEQNIVSSEEIRLLPPLNTVEEMLKKTLTALEDQKQAVENNNHLLEEIRAEAAMLKSEKEQLSEINVALSADAEDIKSELLKQIRLHEELQELYSRKAQENESNIELLKQLKEKTQEIKQSFAEKEQSFNETVLTTNVKIADLSKTIEELKLENVNLKTIYDVVKKEKESCGVELEKSYNTIKKHNDEIEKLTSDILVLRESIRDNCSVRENLKMEVKSLIEQNKSLTEQIEQRTLECSRLETNIKTHEKSLQIQSGIILRLQKEKDESVKALVEKEKIIENLSKDCTTKQNEFHILNTHNVELQNEIVGLQVQLGRESIKEEQPTRPSLVCSRRRRQSCHDANRMLPNATAQEENKFEELLSRRNVPDDLFADKEDDESSRSTPIRFSLGRENTCKQEESPPPRPSSVKEIRKRRQSVHDHNRTVNVSHGPDNLKKSKLSSIIPDSEADLKEMLVCYQSEIEELKQQNKELDEECETCATYLREREDQCSRLSKEKKHLQNQVTELRKQLRSYNPSDQSKLHDVAVNTDEDWTNLHSVVVDRLSYDVEVDKNKKLTRALDDFRVRNHELKAAVTKLQNKLQRNLSEGHTKTAKELEAVKLEVESCNQVISELRKRCKEMQADCETQNEFIREKDKEIAILRDTSVALEAKLKEFNTQQHEFHQLKLNMFQVNQQKALLEQQLMSVTAATPLYVAAGSAIVQNQQMSDIMKENQKLKTVNAKLMNICKKRTKANRENDEPSD